MPQAFQIASLCDEALVLLADQVRVSGEDLKRLTLRDDKTRSPAQAIVRPSAHQPFSRLNFFQNFKNPGDKGAKALLADDYKHCQIDIPNAAFDIDFQSDLT